MDTTSTNPSGSSEFPKQPKNISGANTESNSATLPPASEPKTENAEASKPSSEVMNDLNLEAIFHWISVVIHSLLLLWMMISAWRLFFLKSQVSFFPSLYNTIIEDISLRAIIPPVVFDMAVLFMLLWFLLKIVDLGYYTVFSSQKALDMQAIPLHQRFKNMICVGQKLLFCIFTLVVIYNATKQITYQKNIERNVSKLIQETMAEKYPDCRIEYLTIKVVLLYSATEQDNTNQVDYMAISRIHIQKDYFFKKNVESVMDLTWHVKVTDSEIAISLKNDNSSLLLY